MDSKTKKVLIIIAIILLIVGIVIVVQKVQEQKMADEYIEKMEKCLIEADSNMKFNITKVDNSDKTALVFNANDEYTREKYGDGGGLYVYKDRNGIFKTETYGKDELKQILLIIH